MSVHCRSATVIGEPSSEDRGRPPLEEAVDDLIDETERSTSHIGVLTRRRPAPHVTLARLKRRAQLPRILGHHVDARWSAHEVTLVRSTLRPDGARYEIVERWPVFTEGA